MDDIPLTEQTVANVSSNIPEIFAENKHQICNWKCVWVTGGGGSTASNRPFFKLAPRSGTGLLQLLRVLPSFLPSFCVNNLSSIDWFYMM